MERKYIVKIARLRTWEYKAVHSLMKIKTTGNYKTCTCPEVPRHIVLKCSKYKKKIRHKLNINIDNRDELTYLKELNKNNVKKKRSEF